MDFPSPKRLLQMGLQHWIFFPGEGRKVGEGEEGRWARARLQATFFCSWQMHHAEGPAGGQAATLTQAATVLEDGRLNRGYKPGSSSKSPACTRPTAKIPIIAVCS